MDYLGKWMLTWAALNFFLICGCVALYGLFEFVRTRGYGAYDGERETVGACPPAGPPGPE